MRSVAAAAAIAAPDLTSIFMGFLSLTVEKN
jgi:hypothetical protein